MVHNMSLLCLHYALQLRFISLLVMEKIASVYDGIGVTLNKDTLTYIHQLPLFCEEYQLAVLYLSLLVSMVGNYPTQVHHC